MFKKLVKNRKAQNTAEYALLIALVVAAIIAMQTYAQRALQARIRDGAQYLIGQTNGMGTTAQYEPYYLNSSYNVDRQQSDSQLLGTNLVSMDTTTNSFRDTGGFQSSSYINISTNNI